MMSRVDHDLLLLLPPDGALVAIVGDALPLVRCVAVAARLGGAQDHLPGEGERRWRRRRLQLAAGLSSLSLSRARH